MEGLISENEKEEAIQEEEKKIDIYELFSHYNSLYFDDILGYCLLSWSSDRQMNSFTGACRYDSRGGCEILLSEPLLKSCSTDHIKNALLHEMIHALLWIKHENRDHSDHGSSFQEVRNSVNSISVIDPQRPCGGYNITLDHEFRKEVTEPEPMKEIKTYKFHRWICDSCGDLVKKSREPSARDCIDKAGPDESCDNLSCHWHNHKNACSGSYILAESLKYKDKQTSEEELDRNHGSSKELPDIASQSIEKVFDTEASNGKNDMKVDSKDEQELETLPYLTRQTAQKLCLAEQPNEKSYGKKSMTIADYFQRTEDTRRNDASSDDDCCEEMPCEWSVPNIAKGQSFAKKASKPEATSKQRCNSKRRNRYGRWENKDTIVGDWICMYGDEEEDEEVEPLINKRTERRKRMKLLQNAKNDATETEVRNEEEHEKICKDGELIEN